MADSIEKPGGYAKRVPFGAGQELFRQGQPPHGAYLIERGRIEISFELEGEKIVVGYREPGELVGEMALIDQLPRSATATAVEPTVCIIVPEALLAEHIARATPMIKKLLSTFSKNLRDAIDNQIVTKSRKRSAAT